MFNFTINYNNPQNGATPLYNGNISETSWNTLNTDTSTRSYLYSYDALNRITAATSDASGNYNVSGITYDKNGNIKNLTRNGWQNSSSYANMDVLSYDYGNTNQLNYVTDGGNNNYGFIDGNKSGNDYEYDANGNMTIDRNKGVTAITYNHLNLPARIDFGSNRLEFTYDASGNKLRKKKVENGTPTLTDYAGNYVYENGALQYFSHPEGYVQKDGSSFSYVYQYKDHLGNIRLSYTDANNDGTITASTEIIEESNHYPFGLRQIGYNGATSSSGNDLAQKKGFANKELQDDLGLNVIDFGARMYDPTIARWNAIDPLAEEYFNDGTYNYVQNTPMRAIDPNGMEIVIIGDKKYTQRVLDYLSKLGSSSKKGAQLILDAIKSDKQFVIFDPSNENASKELDNFQSDQGYETLAFNTNQVEGEYGPDNGRNGKSLEHTGETILAHELSHFNNTKDNEPNYLTKSDGYRGPLSSEVNAVKEENQVRREMGLPERTHYQGVNVYGKKANRQNKYNSKLVRDKDYSVNVPGIGKKTFQLIINHYTNVQYERLKKYYKGGKTLVGGNQLKNPKQKKQLLINSVK